MHFVPELGFADTKVACFSTQASAHCDHRPRARRAASAALRSASAVRRTWRPTRVSPRPRRSAPTDANICALGHHRRRFRAAPSFAKRLGVRSACRGCIFRDRDGVDPKREPALFGSESSRESRLVAVRDRRSAFEFRAHGLKGCGVVLGAKKLQLRHLLFYWP